MWRFSAFLLLLFSALFLPFWLFTLLAAVGMFFFPYFFEATALFLVSDLLFGVSEARFFGFAFVSFAFSVVFLLLLELIKKKIRN